MSPRLSSPAHPSQGGERGRNMRMGGGGGRGRGRGGLGRDKEFVGQTIKITQGPYKGHIGIVKVIPHSLVILSFNKGCRLKQVYLSFYV